MTVALPVVGVSHRTLVRQHSASLALRGAAPPMASWIPEMLELVKAVERSPSPPGNINCATYLAAVDNISKVYAARTGRPGPAGGG